MNTDFDPRAWNLFAGVALLTAGCGARVAGNEAADSGETADTADTVDTVDTQEGPECVTAADCPDFYSCNNGMCEYYEHHDGWIPYYECYSNAECGEFEICEFGYCEPFGYPPPSCTTRQLPDPVPLPLPIPTESTVLALTFADVDADGQDELVLATETELWVYEPDGSPATASSRELGPILAMVAGSFDAVPGEDVMLLVYESLALYGSNGDGTFAAPTTTLPPLGSVTRLLAAELDEQPPTDLIGWGGLGAFMDRNGQTLVFGDQQYGIAGAVHPFGTTASSIVLRRGAVVDVFALDGAVLAGINIMDGPATLAAFTRGSDDEYLYLVNYPGWSRVERVNGVQGWSVPGEPERLFAGDIDGDGNDDLLFFGGDQVMVEMSPGGEGDCTYGIPLLAAGIASEAVVGDHDGDGNQEFAIRTDVGEVLLFDGG